MASNFNSVLLGHTMLVPHSAGVYIPSTEAGNSKVKIELGNSKRASQFSKTIIDQDAHPVGRKYLDMISTRLTFSCDVIEDRCLHMMPYNEKYFADIFEPGELKSDSKRPNTVHGLIKKSADTHQRCYHLKPISKPNCLVSLESTAKNKALQLHKQALLASQDTKKSMKTDLTLSDSSGVFMTEINSSDPNVSITKIRPLLKKEPEVEQFVAKNNITVNLLNSETTSQSMQDRPLMIIDNNVESASKHIFESHDNKENETEAKDLKSHWDDHLLSKLSLVTANWIVHECIPEDKQKERLSSVLKSWYGHQATTELVSEEVSDGDDASKKKQKPKRKWKKAEAAVLARVYNITPPPAKAVDPYSDDNKAPFYRQPAGIRKQKKIHDKEIAGAVNTTACNITVPEHVEIPQPKVTDFLNPRVGNKIYETDNLYQLEWLTGKSHVFNIDGDPSEILMETENKYRKQLQQEMPLKHDMWYTSERDKAKEKFLSRKPAFQKPKRGLKRWIGLPQPVNEREQLMTMAPTEFDSNIQKSTDSAYLLTVRQNHALVSIVHDWRSKWFLCGQFADSTPDDLIRDMADIQPHVRLKAIGTIAKAVEYKPSLTKSVFGSNLCNNLHDLPEKIFIALECLLDDSHDQVRKAAAVTLYTLDRPNDKAQGILKDMLMSKSELVRWTGAHCLAHYGECDSDIVAEVIKQILSTESAIKYQQGVYLLAKISTKGSIVHCMVAEQLNSNIWRHRMIACQILPTLFGPINRDITQKLSNMMWHDWHVEVRNAAAQCLGKTSHGRDVHDGIKDKLLHGTEKTKLEAISKLGQLGIMTAKLLPAFLLCFANPFVSIRCELCIACGNLQIKESQVISQLVNLVKYDSSWKVKALATQALGKIGEVNGEIKESLLWAVRYEEQPGVRAEACHSLVALNIQGDDVIDTLQERLLVESSQIVKEEVTEALSILGFSTTEDSEMVAQVKSEVRKLCNQNIISSQILVNEMDDNKRAQLTTMVYLTEKDVEALNSKKAEMHENILSQAKQIDSPRSTDKPKVSTPLSRVKATSSILTPEPLSREGTDFTLAADKELEALLNHGKSESWSGSSKSSPLTRESPDSVEGKDVRGMWQDGTNKHSIIIHAAMDEEGESQSNFISREVTDIESEEEKGTKSADLSHYLSLPRSRIETSSQDGLLSSSTSAVDSKSSRLSPAQFYSHRSKVNKDIMKEKKKFNKHVSATCQKLNARYVDLSKDLMKIDRGYNISEFSGDGTNVVMSNDEILLTNSVMTNTLLSNDDTSTVIADPVELGVETQEILQRNGEIDTIKISIANIDTEIQETLQRNGEIGTIKNSIVVLDTEIPETLQRNSETGSIKDSIVVLDTEIHKTLQKNGQTDSIKDFTVDKDT